MQRNKMILIFMSVILIVFSFYACSADLSLSERYPGPWRDDFNAGITKALAASNIRDCGQYKYRESSKDKSEYLVYCTRDGSNWTAYLVWANIGKVTGPHTIDLSLK